MNYEKYINPKHDSDWPAMVIELKWNDSAESAIDQILKRKYPAALEGYGSEILLIGISNNKDLLAGERRHTSGFGEYTAECSYDLFGTYLFPLIAAYIVSLFVAATVGENRQEYRWLFRILTILAGTGIIALILAQLTGNLVLADEVAFPMEPRARWDLS